MNFKETEWPEFNEAMKKFVMVMRDDIIHATYGRGQYRVMQEYVGLLVSHQEWIKMTSQQMLVSGKCDIVTQIVRIVSAVRILKCMGSVRKRTKRVRAALTSHTKASEVP